MTAQARCVAGKAYVAVQARNDHGASVDIVLETAYGGRSVPSVAPGANAFQQFATRTAAVGAGPATVRASGSIGGRDVTSVFTADYSGLNCAG